LSIVIAVAIVNHNTRRELEACLASVSSEMLDEVVIVDTASIDGSADMVRAQFANVTLIEMENRGYGAAANRAVAATKAPFVLLLNGDTRLECGVARALGTYLEENPRVAIAGPRVVSRDGTADKTARRFPTPFEVLLEESGLHRIPVPGLHRTAPERPTAVDAVLGAALAIRRTAFESVGGFDERYFMYGEEDDLCARLRAAGWAIHYAPVGTIVHVGGASTRQVRAAMLAEFVRGRFRLYRQHLPPSRRPQLALIFGAAFAARFARDRIALTFSRDEAARRDLSTELGAWRAGLRVLWEEMCRGSRLRSPG
jgi:GT2 family glycosyltransferase